MIPTCALYFARKKFDGGMRAITERSVLGRTTTAHLAVRFSQWPTSPDVSSRILRHVYLSRRGACSAFAQET
jgi:hypothetical protein